MGNASCTRWLILCCLLSAGCSSKPPPEQTVSQRVGPAGGTVQTQDGASVEVPSGVLAAETTFTIAASQSTSPRAVGPAYVFGPEGATFAQPVTVTLPFSPDRLPAGATGADVVVLTAPLGSTAFESLGGALVDNTHVRAPTTHFSVLVAGVLGTGTSDGGGADGGGGDGGSDCPAAPPSHLAPCAYAIRAVSCSWTVSTGPGSPAHVFAYCDGSRWWVGSRGTACPDPDAGPASGSPCGPAVIRCDYPVRGWNGCIDHCSCNGSTWACSDDCRCTDAGTSTGGGYYLRCTGSAPSTAIGAPCIAPGTLACEADCTNSDVCYGNTGCFCSVSCVNGRWTGTGGVGVQSWCN